MYFILYLNNLKKKGLKMSVGRSDSMQPVLALTDLTSLSLDIILSECVKSITLINLVYF